MLRQSVLKLARVNTPFTATRAFSMASVRAGEGDTGSMRSTGSASADAFTKREQASENLFIRQKEMESLKKLKEKLAMQRKHLDELDEHIKELESDRGGEQNH